MSKFQSTSRGNILIIGGGVTGLTTAWELIKNGYTVTVLAKQYAPADPRIVSQIAGALWEWPPAVCGSHTDPVSLTHSKVWCLEGYRRFEKMASDPKLSKEAGVRMRVARFFFDEMVKDGSKHLAKREEIEAQKDIKGFRKGPHIIQEMAGLLDPNTRCVDAYEYLAPIVDTDQYMRWLFAHLKRLGAKLLVGEVHGLLIDQEEELLTKYNAQAIVNCSGLFARELAGDNLVYPLRGSLIRVINDGSSFPKLETALCVSHDDSNEEGEDIVFILPRNDTTLLLGGLAEPHEWEMNLTLESPQIKRMYERCLRFYPALKNAKIDLEYPLAMGLRPLRSGNVRCEPESALIAGRKARIFHSYGHGGSGFTLSFGCAQKVVLGINSILRDIENSRYRQSHL